MSDPSIDFERLFEDTQSMVYSLGLRLFRYNTEDALDFTQDVYLQAYKKLDSFQGKSRASTWLYSLALNLGLNKIRKEKRLKTISSDSENIQESLSATADENTPEEELVQLLEQKEVEDSIRAALNRLPELYRLPMILHYYEKMPYKDISERLGVKEGTLKSNIHRAKVMLRDYIKKNASSLLDNLKET